MSKKKNNEELEKCKCNCSNEEGTCECGDSCECEENCECNCNNELEEKVKKLEEALLRNQAELINFKRRKEEETSRLLICKNSIVFVVDRKRRRGDSELFKCSARIGVHLL